MIPYGIWNLFKDKIAILEGNNDQDEFNNYLENFERLEGQEYVVILESDLEKFCNRA